jgi:hypothetical protein
MSAIKIIQAFAKKSLTKDKGSGITSLPSQFMAESKAGEIAAVLQRAGIPINQLDDYIRSEKDLIKYLNIIEATSKPNYTVFSGQEAADQLNKLFPKKGEVVKFPQKRTFKEEIEAMKKSGDLVDEDNMVISEKITDREMFKNSNLNKEPVSEKFIDYTIQDINKKEPIEGMKIANKIIKREGEFKDLTEAQSQRILKETDDHLTGKDIDYDPEDFYAQGGRAGLYTGGMVDVEPNLSDIGHGSDALMARTRLVSPGSQSTTSTGLNYLLAEDNDNIRVPFAGGESARYENYYIDPKTGELKKKPKLKQKAEPFYPKDFNIKDYYDPKPFYPKDSPLSEVKFAEGGRIGFKVGGDAGRRAFLKLLATLGGGIAGLKSGLFGMGGKEAGKKAITETVKQSAGSGTPPPYFFELVETISKNGREIKSYGERIKQTIAPSKDGKSELLLTEDLNTGSVQIKKIHKEGDNMVTKSEEMNYTRNTGDESTKGKPVDDYEEVTEFNSRIYKDNFNEPDYVDGIDVESIVKEVDVKKADGGRIGLSGGGLLNVLSRLGITGSSRRFLEKSFGKDVLEEITKKDPDMHRGLLEVVEMFRNRDKEGLKMYMQKFLPHMDDAEIEQFIVGTTPDVEGLSGQLIRLGSGRDYAQKLEMMNKAKQAKKLQEFDIKNVTKNAEGGRIGFSGGGIFRAIIAKAAAAKGMKPYEFIKVTSYKSLPREVKMFMSAEDFAQLKSGQKQMYSNYIDMAKTRKNFQQEVEGGKTTPAKPLFESMEKMMDEQSYVPKNVTTDDIAEMELMVKNRFNKGRKDNALGGLQTMLGE